MFNVIDKNNFDYNLFLETARASGIHINKNLFIKKIADNNFGVFSRGEININNKVISIPKKFLISQRVMKDFINKEKIEYPYPNILKLYCSSLPNFEYFMKNHIAFANNEQKKQILNFFIEQSPTRRKIKSFFDYIDKLNSTEKYLFLIFRSRAFNFENSSYLVPVLDMVNYKYGAERALTDKKEIYLKNKKILKINDQFFHGYEIHSDIISFFLQFNFIPENFNLISIPPNFFSMKIPENNDVKINENYWKIKDGAISNKSYVIFEDLKLPLEFKLETSKIIKNPSAFNKVLNSILGLLKNEINFENLSKFLEKESEDSIIVNFAKVVLMNYSKISDAQKNLIN